MAALDHAIDEIEQLAVGPVLDAARRVVLQPHTPVRDLPMQLEIRVAVEVGEDDPVSLYALPREQVDDLVTARSDLGVDEDGRAGLAAARRRGDQPALLERADALVGSPGLDHARAR